MADGNATTKRKPGRPRKQQPIDTENGIGTVGESGTESGTGNGAGIVGESGSYGIIEPTEEIGKRGGWWSVGHASKHEENGTENGTETGESGSEGTAERTD